MRRHDGHGYRNIQKLVQLWLCRNVWRVLLQLQFVCAQTPILLPVVLNLRLHTKRPAFSGVGLQIPPWLYGVEITPLKLRYFAGAIAAASGSSALSPDYVFPCQLNRGKPSVLIAHI